MGNALFIVWRESAEAMLVVGILYAWLKRQPDAARGFRYLWGGVAAGVGLAAALALVMLGITTYMSGDALEYFQAGMMLVAFGLIVQMVFWMRRHGRTFKRDLEANMQGQAEAANWWGMLLVVALAVGRESSEAVVFLYGLGLERQGLPQFLLVLALGIAAAYGTFWLLQQGGKVFSWRLFFRVSEILLLLLAGALLVSGIDKLTGLGLLPALYDPLWDSSFLLDDGGRIGNVVSALTGYRSRPSLLALAALTFYWAAVIFALRRPQPARLNAKPAPIRG